MTWRRCPTDACALPALCQSPCRPHPGTRLRPYWELVHVSAAVPCGSWGPSELLSRAPLCPPKPACLLPPRSPQHWVGRGAAVVATANVYWCAAGGRGRLRAGLAV